RRDPQQSRLLAAKARRARNKRGLPDSASLFNDLIRGFGFSGMDIRPPERTATLFARPKPRDGTLLRLAAWGLCATMSAALLVFVAQTPAGGARIKLALSGL